MALTIRDEKIISQTNGVKDSLFQFDVDEVSELPTPEYAGRNIHQGSTAVVIHDSSIYMMDGKHKWVELGGTE